MGENEKPKKRWIVQRAVLPIVEESPSETVPGGSEPVVTLLPVRDADRLTEDAVVWEDFKEVEVPVGTQRNTVVSMASREIPDEGLPQFFRALGDDEAPIPVRIAVPPPPPARRTAG